MEPILRKPGLWLCAALVTTAVAAVAAGQGTAQPAKGEQLMNGGCLTCHDLRPIQITALNNEGWQSVIGAMIEKGAEVAKPDIPLLAEYLATHYGPLPDGTGKKILLNTCTVCHDLSRVKRTAATREEWEEILGAMLNEGAMLSEEDFPVLLGYLARNFR